MISKTIKKLSGLQEGDTVRLNRDYDMLNSMPQEFRDRRLLLVVVCVDEDDESCDVRIKHPKNDREAAVQSFVYFGEFELV